MPAAKLFALRAVRSEVHLPWAENICDALIWINDITGRPATSLRKSRLGKRGHETAVG
jgi:hypothetical protein